MEKIDAISGQGTQTAAAQQTTGVRQQGTAAGPVQTGAVASEDFQGKSLEQRAKEVVTQNNERLESMEKTGKMPPLLPMEEANDNFKTVVDYLGKSNEVPDEYKKIMGEDIGKAGELYKNKNPNGLPFPVHLAQVMGQDDRIPPSFSLSAIDFTRSFQAYAGQ